jgi:hypothetical protein
MGFFLPVDQICLLFTTGFSVITQRVVSIDFSLTKENGVGSHGIHLNGKPLLFTSLQASSPTGPQSREFLAHLKKWETII